MLNWRAFIRTFCYAAVGFAGILYLFILLVDPYDSVPFSLPLDREPISTNQRFAYPSLARSPRFDSVIVGTSTSRLLKPQRLNKLTGGNWANLAMNSATAYEQMEMLALFLRNHPETKNILIGIDDAWCRSGPDIKKFTFRPFPPWMYDENEWNDLLYLFNDKAFENTVRLIEFWMGKREAKYDLTGYRDFTADFGEYDKAEVARRIHDSTLQIPHLEHDNLEPLGSWLSTNSGALKRKRLMIDVIGSLPKNTKINLVLMPLNGFYLSRSKSTYQNCKGVIFDIMHTVPEVKILDWMKINQMTLNIGNYWDPLHFTNDVAVELEKQLYSEP